jgi:hypothetical protein
LGTSTLSIYFGRGALWDFDAERRLSLARRFNAGRVVADNSRRVATIDILKSVVADATPSGGDYLTRL